MAFINFFFFLKKLEKVEKTVFLGIILRFTNVNVLHKGLLLQDWVFTLGKDQCFVKECTCTMNFISDHDFYRTISQFDIKSQNFLIFRNLTLDIPLKETKVSFGHI